MNEALKASSRLVTWGAMTVLTIGIAWAQDPGATGPSVNSVARPEAKDHPKSSAIEDAGEPRASAAPEPSASPDSSPAPGPNAERSAAAGRPAGGTKQKGPSAADRVDLSTATVTGDREQPKVMYIVPWKRSDIGDLSGKPMNSLLDEALTPVDRDEFKREVAYYDAVKSDAPQNGAKHGPAQVEK